ncbi:MAG: MFS transporter [Flavipsychrobacter sp.]|nr:MFS transporter [Flavipsychrobacter sp.]
MRSNRFWLNLLNIQKQEWPLVKKLFWLQFFQGAGISFFFTAEFARFLEKFPVHELPWVMVLSSLLLWLTGFAYTVLEHHIPFKKFNAAIIFFMAGTMLLVRVGSTVITDNWLYYASLAWFYVLYLLNNLEFWGIASRLFNIRQSKRLFGVVSSGDIPAKFIGYTLALIVVPYTGTLNLLLLGVISMLISIPFYRSIAKSESVHFEDVHESDRVHHSSHPVRNLYLTFVSNKIIRRIAIISLLATACVIIVNYGFYAKIKESYHNDVELAKFIAFFMAGLRIIALITKTIFTSRLTTNLGIQKSLFITPLLLLGLVSIIIGTSYFNQDERFIFFIFGASSIAVDVLRTAINSPVLLTIMQPLPIHERMRAHNIIKGIMDPFATLFSGVLLLLLLNYHGDINLLTLCYTLIILVIGWLTGIVFVNKEYVNMLVTTISSRYFSQEEFTLNDSGTLNKIKEKIEHGSEQEVLSILSMVASKQNPISIELLRLFVNHPADAVKKEAIRLVSRKNIFELQSQLKDLSGTANSRNVSKEATQAVCKLTDSLSEALFHYNQADTDIQEAAVCGMLCNKQKSIRFTAEEIIATLIRSASPEERKKALDILGIVADEYEHPLHSVLLISEKDDPLLEKGLSIIGHATSLETIKAAMQCYIQKPKLVKSALLRAGTKAVPEIENFLRHQRLSHSESTQLILLIGKIGGEEARLALGRLISEKEANLPATIKAMYRSKYKAVHASKSFLEDIARAYIRYAVELLFMQRKLQEKTPASGLLQNAIQIELTEIRELLLCLFGCIYERKNIKKSRTALMANKKETIANAMEIIEVTVKKELSKYFTAIYEDSGIEERCNALRSVYQSGEFKGIGAILDRILSEQPIIYQDWTKACSLYVAKKYAIEIDPHYCTKYLKAENPLLQETAVFASN